jgi:hypothetical protein
MTAMYKIEISDETAESMFRDILIEDYRRIRGEIYAFTNRAVEIGELKSFEREDLENCKQYLEAMKVMLGYYLPQSEADIIIGEA